MTTTEPEQLTEDVAKAVVGMTVEEAQTYITEAGKDFVLPGVMYTMVYKSDRIRLVVEPETGIVVRAKIG